MRSTVNVVPPVLVQEFKRVQHRAEVKGPSAHGATTHGDLAYWPLATSISPIPMVSNWMSIKPISKTQLMKHHLIPIEVPPGLNKEMKRLAVPHRAM